MDGIKWYVDVFRYCEFLNTISNYWTCLSSRQRYLSAIIDGFLTFSVTFFNENYCNNKMNRKHCLAYILFATYTCNGTSVIAEIVRMMEDRTLPWYKDIQDFNLSYVDGDFYRLLCFLADQMFFKAVGSCTNPRHTFTNTKDLYDFSQHSDALLKDLDNISNASSSSYKKVIPTFIGRIVKSMDGPYKGMGLVVAHNYVQLCSLLGLIPLQCYQYAATMKSGNLSTGPAKFIAKCFNVGSENSIVSAIPGALESIFEEAYSDLNKIWKSRVSKEIQENSFCEINRIIEDTDLFKERKNLLKTKKLKIPKHCPIIGPDEIEKIFTDSQNTNQSILFDNTGTKRDTIYLYRARRYVRQIQPIFEIKKIGKRTLLKMTTHLIDKNGTHELENIDLTDWSGQCDQIVDWNAHGNLNISDTLREIYEISTDYSTQCANGDCESCCEYTLKKSKVIRLTTPVKILPPRKLPSQQCPFSDTADSFTSRFIDKTASPPTCLEHENQKKLFSDAVHRLEESQNSQKTNMKLAIRNLQKNWNQLHN